MLLDDVAPRGHGDLGSNTQETQPCLDQNRGGKVGRADDHERAHGIGEHVAKHDAPCGEVQRLGRLHVSLLPKAEKLSPNNARHFHPHGEADGEKHLPKPLSKGEGDGQHHQQSGDGPHHLQEPRQDGVHPAPEVAGESSQQQSKDEADEHGTRPHGKGNAAAGHESAEQVASVSVRAEPGSVGHTGLILPLGTRRKQPSVEVLVVGHGAGVRTKRTAHHRHRQPKQDPHSTEGGHLVREECVHGSQVRPFQMGFESMPMMRSMPKWLSSSAGT